MRKVWLWYLFLLLSLVFVVSPVLGDGGLVYRVDYDEHVYLPEQKAVLFWDGTNETMILSSKFQSENITDMAWMIPIYSSTPPNVTAGNMEIFSQVATAFAEKEYFESNPLVQVFLPCALAIIVFIIALLVLIIALIQRKSKKVYMFIIIFVVLFLSSLFLGMTVFFRLNMSGGLGPGETTDDVTVVEMKKVDIYDIVILQSTNASELFSWLHDHQYYISIETNAIVQDYCNESNVYFIVNRINLTDHYSNDAEHNQIINDLETGIATPLQIKFQPETLFYPLKMTSINQGNTKINVYVMADEYVTDESDLLQVKDVETLYYGQEYGEYVTWLTFEGSTSNLIHDSFFS